MGSSQKYCMGNATFYSIFNVKKSPDFGGLYSIIFLYVDSQWYNVVLGFPCVPSLGG